MAQTPREVKRIVAWAEDNDLELLRGIQVLWDEDTNCCGVRRRTIWAVEGKTNSQKKKRQNLTGAILCSVPGNEQAALVMCAAGQHACRERRLL